MERVIDSKTDRRTYGIIKRQRQDKGRTDYRNGRWKDVQKDRQTDG